MRTSRLATFALSAVLMVSGVPANAFAQSDSQPLGQQAQTTDDSLEQRARTVASSLMEQSEGEALSSLWDRLATCTVTEDSQRFASTDEAALAALDGAESTAAGIARAFVCVAREIGFTADEQQEADGQVLARITIADKEYVLDVHAGNAGAYPWDATDTHDSVPQVAKDEDQSTLADNALPSDEEDTSTESESNQEELSEKRIDSASSSTSDAAVHNDLATDTAAQESARQRAAEEARAIEEARAADAAREASVQDEKSRLQTTESPETTNMDPKTGIEPQSNNSSVKSLSNASIAAIPDQPYTGKAVSPKPNVSLDGKTLKEGTDYTIGYDSNTNPGTAKLTITGRGSYTGSKTASFNIVTPSVRYRTHVQTYGDQPWRQDGSVSGTSGESKRLEGIWMELGKNFPLSGGISYKTHVQTFGWEDSWRTSGQKSGTSGMSKRLEAIQIKLTGDISNHYDVYYRVHAQRVGWMSWAKNGQSAGTSAMSWRLEALQVVLVPKGSSAPQSLEGITPTYSAAYLSRPNVTYHTHVQTHGWEQRWRSNGELSGTSGQSKRLEGIEAKLEGGALSGNIEYQTHIQTYGWEKSWHANGDMSGTQGQSKRLEAIRMRLTGEAEKYLDVWYRVHAQTAGWLGWAKNGEDAGTAGMSKRLEAIQIMVLPKGASAPGDTSAHFLTSMRDIYIERYLAEAVKIANDDTHGYSQEDRWGPDYDCSSLVVTSLMRTGLPTGDATYTGNMLDLLNYGWDSYGYVSEVFLKRGDILLTPNYHTEFYMGDGKNVRAWPGPIAQGDQTGEEISIVDYHTNNGRGWDYVLRLR